MYVYRQSEPGVYTVGFYSPDGEWWPESDHASRAQAAERVAWLNGTKATVDDGAYAHVRSVVRQETATAITRALTVGVERCLMRWRGQSGAEAEFVRWDEVQRVLRAHGGDIPREAT